MLSQAKLKLIRSLDHKKSRRESGLFVAEGPKVVGDLMAVMSPRLVVATEVWLSGHDVKGAEAIEVSEAELKKASFLQHPQQVLALFPIPTESADEGLETEAAKVQKIGRAHV